MTDHSGGPEVRGGAVIAFLALLAAYHAAFGRFFPTAGGTIGEDYGLTLPGLLSGYFWYRANGPLAVPWFTPAFCGGQPSFADPQSAYYSVPQLATTFVDPLTGVYLTMLLFAAAGYWGCYLLLRRTFALGQFAAILGAAVFMFNGFFAHRMLIGHAGYHGFMLVPWIPYLLAVRPRQAERPRWGGLAAACAAGLIAAYWVESGLGTLILPLALAAIAVLLLREFRHDGLPWRQVALRSLVAGLVAGSISAAKVAVAGAVMAHFPRALYPLPGYRSFADAVHIAYLGLFVSPSDIAVRSRTVLENAQWALDRHELEYGVTFVPLAIIAVGALAGLWRVLARRPRVSIGGKRLGLFAGIVLVLVVPLALNTYSPEWNAMLKATPLLKAASTLVRWYCIYIPVIAVLSAVAIGALPVRLHAPVATIGIAAVAALNLAADRGSYTEEGYAPVRILAAYRAVRAGNAPPPIDEITLSVDRVGRPVLSLDRNDALTAGMSQLLCYNPIFGYRLEAFPIGTLHPGPVRDVTNGRYNVKNPACYVFPEENRCAPGDHFRADQGGAMEAFVAYRPFPFEMSRPQKLANALTLLGLAASVLILASVPALALIRRTRKARVPPAR